MSEKDRFRKRQFKVFLTEEEFQILEQNAYELSISKTEFIRQIIIYGRLTENVVSMDRTTEKIYNELIFEMNRIGNNINQIAYLCNTKQKTEKEDIKLLKSEMIELMQEIIEFIKRK